MEPTPARPLGFADYAALGFGVMVVLGGALAALFAALHQAQIDDVRAYRESALMLPELGTLLCSCGNQPLNAIAFVTLLVRKRWMLATVVAIAGVVGLVLSYVAVALDSSTLLYAS